MTFKELIGCAVVGKCFDLKTLRNLDTILVDNRIGGVTLSYYGGLSMILKFDDDESCANFLLNHQVWKEWFSSLEPWDGQPLPFERLAWVKVQGVPLQLVDNDVLNNIAEHFGKIVHGSQLEAEDDNLSFSWIGVLIGEGGRIHDHVTLKWKSMQFRMCIEEESSVWTPDSVGRVVVPDCNSNEFSGRDRTDVSDWADKCYANHNPEVEVGEGGVADKVVGDFPVSPLPESSPQVVEVEKVRTGRGGVNQESVGGEFGEGEE
ncbi:hypothetical protein Hdeb2414_s0021g00577131 [Helianthus debilis subsp. tardiflorus]